jgi:hypothetical protein
MSSVKVGEAASSDTFDAGLSSVAVDNVLAASSVKVGDVLSSVKVGDGASSAKSAEVCAALSTSSAVAIGAVVVTARSAAVVWAGSEVRVGVGVGVEMATVAGWCNRPPFGKEFVMYLDSNSKADDPSKKRTSQSLSGLRADTNPG